jgi:hypothetical protein
MSNDRAQHRAVVIHEVQHHRPLAEELGQADGLTPLVGERQVERQRGAELLVEADLGEHRWPLCLRLGERQDGRALGHERE